MLVSKVISPSLLVLLFASWSFIFNYFPLMNMQIYSVREFPVLNTFALKEKLHLCEYAIFGLSVFLSVP